MQSVIRQLARGLASAAEAISAHRMRRAVVPGGPKGPPSAPPARPPIIINPVNPFSEHVPEPSIDPLRVPMRPPVMPPGRPGFYLART
jgi:hypothetical protein